MRELRFQAMEAAQPTLVQALVQYKKDIVSGVTNKEATGLDLADMIANAFSEAGFEVVDRQEIMGTLARVIGSEQLLHNELEQTVNHLRDTMVGRRRDSFREV